MTASGDGSAHIWKAAVIPDRLAHAIGGVSSEESADSESEDTGGVHYPKEIHNIYLCLQIQNLQILHLKHHQWHVPNDLELLQLSKYEHFHLHWQSKPINYKDKNLPLKNKQTVEFKKVVGENKVTSITLQRKR